MRSEIVGKRVTFDDLTSLPPRPFFLAIEVRPVAPITMSRKRLIPNRIRFLSVPR